MPLPTSGPISLADIAAEFGGAAPHSLSEYYRGGGLVPNTQANVGIPTSGTIKFSDFYGGDVSQGIITLSGGNASAVDNEFGPWQSIVGFRINTNGTISKYEFTNDAPERITQLNPETDWIIPNSSAGTQYEFMLEIDDGGLGGSDLPPNFNSNAINTWISLRPGLGWHRQRTAEGQEFVNWKISVRENGGPVITFGIYRGTISNGSIIGP